MLKMKNKIQNRLDKIQEEISALITEKNKLMILLRQTSTPSMQAKATEYAKAETYNALHGAAAEDAIAERLKICGGCEFRKTDYLGATASDNFGWCSKCGCGNNPRALLNTKVKLAKSTCPLTPPKWKQVEGVGGSVASVVDSVKGVAQSIKHLLTGNNDTPPAVS